MTDEEYSKLFHELGLNEIAFQQLFQCSDSIKKMIEVAVDAERNECANLAALWQNFDLAAAIRARGNK